MKILITHVYSQQNKGDAAILAVQVRELKRVFPHAKVSISTMEDINNIKPSDRNQYLQSFFYLAIYKNPNTVIRIINSIYILTTTTIWAWIYGRYGIRFNLLLTKDLLKILNHYLNSDIIVPVGGGYLNAKNDLKSTLSLILQLHSIYIAKKINKPVYLYSQSIGPLTTNLQKHLTAFVLNQVDHIFVRENISIKLLEEISVDQSLYTRSIDAAFLFKSSSKRKMGVFLQNKGLDLSKPIIGITARNWLEKIGQRKYEKSIAEFIEWATSDRKTQVLLIPQVTSTDHNDDDRIVNRSITNNMSELKNVYLLDEQFNIDEIKGIYENLNFLIGTRMHSCIFSLTSKVPVIAIEYEYKTKGIMKDLKLDNWLIRIDKVTSSNLRKKFQKLVKNKKQYITLLDNNLTQYANKVRQISYLIKEHYKNIVLP